MSENDASDSAKDVTADVADAIACSPGAVHEYPTPTGGGAPLGAIVLGPDGNLWCTEQAMKIARSTPAGVIVEFLATTDGGWPPSLFGIAVGPIGRMTTPAA